jgi:hypothetical protein
MSWLFSQALVAEYLGENSLDGEQSVQSNGKNTQLVYLPQDKMMEFSRLSRFGMMFKPLMESLGEELLMSYLADFHAKTSQLQEQEMALTEKDQECGRRWQGLLAKYDPNTHSLRTVQCSLLEDLNECLQTWPAWGSMRNGECWEQTKSEQTIKEIESGLLEKMPTPNSWDAKRGPMSKELMETGKHQVSLVTYVKHNPKKWPTPTCSDVYTDNLKSTQQKEGSMHSVTLPQAVRMWGTPKSQDSRHALRDRGKGNLGEQVSGMHNGGRLNPLWTEWLMGWPIGWTDLKPLETDKYRYVLQPLGTS